MAENQPRSIALLAASLAADGATGPDAELIRLCAENIASVKAYDRDISGDDSENNPHWIAAQSTCAAIRALRAQTIAGVVAKARVARARAPSGGPEEWDAGVFVSWAAQVVDDLLWISREDGL